MFAPLEIVSTQLPIFMRVLHNPLRDAVMQVSAAGYPDIADFEVLSKSKTATEVSIHLDPASPLLRDHFANFPVVPGVVQLRWIFQQAHQLMPEVSADVQQGYRLANLKFRAPMTPDRSYTLTVELQGSGFRFKIIDARRIISSGTVAFDD